MSFARAIFISAALMLSDSAIASSNKADMESRILKGHNDERKVVGLEPLTWSYELSHSAERYAQELSDMEKFEHSDYSLGENLWMGTKGYYSIEDMVDAWRDERIYYRPGPVPNVSTTGKFGDVGHYTQIVSRRTLRVGCAIKSSKNDDYLVCHYDPPGNITGRTPF